MRPSVREFREELSRTFHRLSKLEQLCHGIPVAAGAGSFEGSLDGRPGHPGARHAVREIDMSLAPVNPQLFRRRLYFQRSSQTFGARSFLEKNDRQFCRVKPAALGKGALRNHLTQFRSGPQDHMNAKAVVLFDSVLDTHDELCMVAPLHSEHDIAALKVRLRVLQPQALIEVPQRVHLDLVVASDIDATEQGNDDGHNVHKYIASHRRSAPREAGRTGSVQRSSNGGRFVLGKGSGGAYSGLGGCSARSFFLSSFALSEGG